MKEYFVYFRDSEGFAKTSRIICSKSLLGAKQKASRIFKKTNSLEITAIEIFDMLKNCVAHKFIGSKKWSSFA
ncbi:hypothetical protein [Leptospira santarosai]|uniref:hypothetical protein n=1 Tax=Leptospira santarosai TaxID=28183 RepID=UPI0005181F4D|nr:hypothetical protein [Leptospira santarosai]